MLKNGIQQIWAIGRSWENRIRVNSKRVNRGYESNVKKLVVNGKIVFKFVKWVGNYVLIIHHSRSVLGTMY